MDTELALRNIVEGIRDHVHSNGFEKVVIGVSGGIDSALVATLAQKALSAANVHCLLMPSQYSSVESLSLGKKLAANLGCKYEIVPIGNILRSYELVLGYSMETITEENLQARIRGNILMAYANQDHRLVLATGNKSEALVGYCTLYGDTVGSIAPIGDVYKTEVYELANYINREGEIIPNGIIEREPTAELSPGQKDTDVLPSYDILDLILDGYEANWELGKIFSRIKSTPEGIKQAFKLETVTAVLDRIKKNKFKAAQCPSALKWRNK